VQRWLFRRELEKFDDRTVFYLDECGVDHRLYREYPSSCFAFRCFALSRMRNPSFLPHYDGAGVKLRHWLLCGGASGFRTGQERFRGREAAQVDVFRIDMFVSRIQLALRRARGRRNPRARAYLGAGLGGASTNVARVSLSF
jgi:hypothetical protein